MLCMLAYHVNSGRWYLLSTFFSSVAMDFNFVSLPHNVVRSCDFSGGAG